MEDRQLNYNQPLLSTRRFPSTPTFSGGAKDQGMRGDPLAKLPPLPPAYRSELKSGPISSPGTVPFTWERSPGRPKHERTMQIQTLRPPPGSPKLSSGRTMNVKKQSLDKVRDSNRNFASQRVNVVPNEASKGGEAAACEGSKKGVSEEGDEVYVDAQDTLSRTESFFFNCSLSGISGLDGPDNGVSGKFSTNPEMQDFMMDRFLPAAQAMASETPPLPSVKTPAAGHVSLAHRVQAKSARNVSSKERSSSEHACDLVSQPRYVNRHPVPGIQDDKLMPNSKSSPINKITCMRESPRADRPFKSRNFRGVSSVHFKTESSHPILQEERKLCVNTRSTENSRVDDFVPPGKALPSFRQFLISEDNAGDTGFTAPSVEKTLYVDPEEDKYSSALDETEMEHERSESTDSISLFPHHRFNEDTQIDVIRPRQSIDVKITYEVCSDGKSGLGSQFSLRLLPAKPSTELAVHLGFIKPDVHLVQLSAGCLERVAFLQFTW
ncbi:hypothetical protein NL676_017353 [Syzygium grande]|nr:hypothetical protein NL676_017353 [Syzygium grande]